MMTTRTPEGPIKIAVTSRSDMEPQLEHAVQLLQEQALGLKDRGILVTRHSAEDFTVELHQRVPFGITQERQEW